ncbi:MAG: helix-turn-helix domain-containing protein [Muribaculum sp.]|nr:helix-turn-helix domain-containing protein [Muribaculum sp.]
MAQLQHIKSIAQARQITIEQLAEQVGVKSQAIHLMVRTGSTRVETLEKIAEVLNVPCKIFFDEKFKIEDFQRLVIQGHHNPFSLYGSANVYEAAKNEAVSDSELVIKTKDDLIASLQTQVADLRSDKEELKETVADLRSRLKELEKKLK